MIITTKTQIVDNVIQFDKYLKRRRKHIKTSAREMLDALTANEAKALDFKRRV